MLESIKIGNFKSISTPQKISNLGNINVLIGENDSGKTTFLEFLWLISEVSNISQIEMRRFIEGNHVINIKNNFNKVKELSQKAREEEFFYNKDISKPITAEFAFKIPEEGERYFNKNVLGDKETLQRQISDLNTFKLEIEFPNFAKGRFKNIFWGNLALAQPENTRKLLDVTQYLRRPNHPKKYQSGSLSSFYNSFVLKIIQDSLKNITSCYIPSQRKIESQVIAHDERVDIKGSFLKRELYRLFHGVPKEEKKYDKVLELFYKITNKKIHPKPHVAKNNIVEIVFKSGDALIDIENSGFGYYQILNIVYNLVMSDANIILIDEPEISLHPQAQARLLKSIKNISEKLNKKFFISTHSPYFIDLEKMENIYKFSKKSSGTIVNQIDNTDLIKRLRDKKERIFYFRFRELFFMTKAIFAEGLEDVDFFLKFNKNNGQIINEAEEIFFQIRGCNPEVFKILNIICEELEIKRCFIYDFDYLLKNREAMFLKAISKISKKFKKLAERWKKVKSGQKKKKREIRDKFFEIWNKKFYEYINTPAINRLIESEKKKGIFIQPFREVGVLKDKVIKNDKLTKEYLTKMFEEIEGRLQTDNKKNPE